MDVNDPEFWAKLGLSYTQTEEALGERKRTQTKRFGEADEQV